jgi:hypothetical protein
MGILMVITLIAATNLIDRGNFIKVKDSITSIYEDRLAASEILFNVSDELHRMKIPLIKSDTVSTWSVIENRLDTLTKLIHEFDKTRLVKSENDVLSQLKMNLTILKKDVNDSVKVNKTKLVEKIDVLLFDVKGLNQIQLSEGGKELLKGERAVQTIEFYTQMEIYALIVLAIFIIVVMAYQPLKKKEGL